MRWYGRVIPGSIRDLKSHIKLKTHEARTRAEIIREIERSGRKPPTHDPRIARALEKGTGPMISFAEMDFSHAWMNLQKFYFRTRTWREIYRKIKQPIVKWWVEEDLLMFEYDIGRIMKNLSRIFLIPFQTEVLNKEFNIFLRDLSRALYRTMQYNIRRQRPKFSGRQIKPNWVKVSYNIQDQTIRIAISPDAYPYIQGLPEGPGAVVYKPELKGDKGFFISKDNKTGSYKGWHESTAPWDPAFRDRFLAVSYYKTLDYTTMFLLRFANRSFKEYEKTLRAHTRAKRLLDFIEKKTGEPVKFVEKKVESKIVDLGDTIFTSRQSLIPIIDALKKHPKWKPPVKEVERLSFFLDDSLGRELSWLRDIFKYGKKRY